MVALTELHEICETFPEGRRDQLIPVLQAVQDRYGYLSHDAMIAIGERLRLPVSKVFGVATFYNQFRFQPQGKVHCQVCRGTACHVNGSAAVLETMQRELGIEAGQTTRDGLFSIEVVACIGACGLAPVVAANGEFHARVTADSMKKMIKQYRKQVEASNGNDE
jgi:NADH:ubiquinone oxidoreductase subunit E